MISVFRENRGSVPWVPEVFLQHDFMLAGRRPAAEQIRRNITHSIERTKIASGTQGRGSEAFT